MTADEQKGSRLGVVYYMGHYGRRDYLEYHRYCNTTDTIATIKATTAIDVVMAYRI